MKKIVFLVITIIILCGCHKDVSSTIFGTLSQVNEGNENSNELKNRINSDLYDYRGTFCDEIAKITKNGKYGWINENGEVIIPCIYDFAFDFSEGMASVKKDDKYGYIDKSGNVIIGFCYDFGGMFNDGMACVCKDGKWGWIDKEENKKIELIYDGVSFELENGVICVKKGNGYGCIDRSGNVVIDFIYDENDVYDLLIENARMIENAE